MESPSVKYLGKMITSEGHTNDPATTSTLEKLREIPKTVGELRHILGFIGWYRSSIPNLCQENQTSL